VFYTYVLRLASDQLYVGHTYDLKKRLAEHKRGGVDATKHRRPFELLFYAAFNSIEKARSFEKYLKSSSGKAFRNKRLI
jgi:putative endonuclease